ncbi:MAG: hypothetical protein V4475_08000 [Pseudomonadota bacterium]
MRSDVTDEPNRWKVAAFVLGVLLFGAFAGDVLLYRRATRPLVAPGTAPLVAEVQRDAAVFFRGSIDKYTFPLSLTLADRTCVELRPLGSDWRGFRECRDRQGRTIEKATLGGGF